MATDDVASDVTWDRTLSVLSYNLVNSSGTEAVT